MTSIITSSEPDAALGFGPAHRVHMVARVRAFALYWLATAAVWIGLLVIEAHLPPATALLVFVGQGAFLVGAVQLIERARPARVVPLLVATCTLLGLAVTGLFAMVGGDGAFLAFVLLTLYLAAAIFFAWGWAPEAALLAGTVAGWLVASPILVFPVPVLQLAAAIVVGSALSLAFAEVRAAGVRADLAHRAREGESRRALQGALEVQREVARGEHEARVQAERARIEAERATRAKDEFLAVVSHELRSPLNAVLAWAQMLQMDFLDEGKARRAVRTIERNARAQLRLIEDLLDISRIVSGKLSVETSTVDLGPVVAGVVDAHRGPSGAKGVALDLHLESDAALVRGDATRLAQVVDNLVGNAIKFTPEFGRVEVRLARQGRQVEIIVRDTGIGIPADLLPHVFDRFRQAESSSTRRHGGLGLGLAIARSLVELHGGSIMVASAGDGDGATFTVRLPLDAAGLATAGVERRGPQQAIRDLPALDRVRVLIVDDEPRDRDIVATMLSHCGASVTAASSVREALSRFDDERPDVIVTDLAMPNEDGFALIEGVRARENGCGAPVPAIALTALASAEDRRRAHAAGFAQHLTKPIEPFAMVSAVARAVRAV